MKTYQRIPAAGSVGSSSSASAAGDVVATVNVCNYTVIGNANVGTGTTARYTFKIYAACTDVVLEFLGWYATTAGEAAAPNTLKWKAAWTRGAGAAPQRFPVTFSLQRVPSIDPWSILRSDPIGLMFAAGDTIEVQVWTDTPAAGSYMAGPALNGGPGVVPSGNGFANAVDAVDTATSLTYANGAGSAGFGLFGPNRILGRVLSGKKPTVAIIGHSIPRGTGDIGSNYSFATRAFNGTYPVVQLALSGDFASNFATAVGSARRWEMASTASYALEMDATNDVNRGDSAATVEASLATIWVTAAARGVEVFTATEPPHTGSTNGWQDQANQTPVASAAVLAAVNDFKRSLPANVAGCVETADVCEVSRNGGKWVTAQVRTIADAAITSATATLTSATANFTAADVGYGVTIAGAGAAGARYLAYIVSFTNATTVVLSANAGTTVAAAAGAIGTPTLDGLHPVPAFHQLMAAAVPVSQFR